MRYLVFILVFLALSCKKDDVVLTPDQQLAHDIEVIDNYIASKHTVGVVKDPSGLRYVVHVEGNGPLADLSSYLKVKYSAGLLPSEDLVDASLEPPTYFFIPLEQMIEGWRIAFQHLPQGTTATLYIPSALAYGPAGANSVPPNSSLIFLVQLIDFYNDEPILDEDANIYNYTLKKDQLWLNTNLTTSTYANGDAIDPLQWSRYEDNPANVDLYGKLYSYATVTDPRKLCPAGYKIPSKSDWERLAAIMAIDQTNAIELAPGGKKESNGTYSGEGDNGVFWASDNLRGSTDALAFLYNPVNNTLASSVVSVDVQASVRCIKGY